MKPLLSRLIFTEEEEETLEEFNAVGAGGMSGFNTPLLVKGKKQKKFTVKKQP
jgi:hypothetical protein